MKHYLFIVTMLLATIGANASNDGKLNAYSRFVYQELKTKDVAFAPALKVVTITGADKKVHSVQAFVKVNDAETFQALRAMGVEIGVASDNIATVTIPLKALDAVLDHEGVSQISFAKEIRPQNNEARTATHTNGIHAGEDGLSSNYTGKGVVYGTVDTGIDFNHYAFRDEKGNTRILYAYLPDATSASAGGVKYTGNYANESGTLVQGEFPGYVYPSSAIGNITTDNNKSSHGTHTMGIGAGGKYGSASYYGMAPEADIVATGCNLSDVAIVNGVALAMQEAEKRNKPCVVNISAGSYIGTAHDGTDLYTSLLASLTGKGKIIVVPSGDDGDKYVYAFKSASQSQGVVALAALTPSGYETKTVPACVVDMWTRNNQGGKVAVCIFNKTRGNLSSLAMVDLNSNSSRKIQNATYFDGEINLTVGFDKNSQKYEAYCDIPELTLKSDDYILSLAVVSSNDVDIWTYSDNGCRFINPVAGFLTASHDASYNTMACHKDIISVGAYETRDKWGGIDGQTHNIDGITLNDYAPFSSYGTTPNALYIPNVVAPGYMISSISSYDDSYDASKSKRNDLASADVKGGREQRYGLLSGTSMSAACLSGIIALWLQASPELTPADLLSTLSNTSINDNYTSQNKLRFGMGKVDAIAGLKEIITTTGADALALNKSVEPLITYADGAIEVSIPMSATNANIEVYTVSGLREAAVKATPGSTTTVQLPANAIGNMHIVRVNSDNNTYTHKLLAK